MSRNFKEMVLMEKYLLEAEEDKKLPNLSKKESNNIGVFFNELNRLLFKYSEATDKDLKKRYFDKFINTYDDVKKRVDEFIKEEKRLNK